jgi:proteasome accessory factor B
MVEKSQVKKEDRLFSLILALTASRDGLTKSDILRSVRGYSERFTFDADPTLDKLFERDKKELRSMGVAIDTFEFSGEEGETHNVRYAISRERYDLPANLSFTPTEVALLNLTSQAWREASLSADSRHALNKIRSLGVAADDSLIGVAPRIRTVDPAFPALTDALENHLILTFLYLKPGENQARLRRVSPLALVNWRDRWYALAFDLDANAERTFLLGRIIGTPARVPQKTWARDDEDYAGRLVSELSDMALRNVAEFAVAPASSAAAQLVSWGAEELPDGILSLSYADLELLADELLPLVGDISVVSPNELVGALEARLRMLSAHHSREVK